MLQSVEAAVQAGFSGPMLDVGGALALSTARGVEPDVAARLIGAASAGIMEGIVDGKGNEDAS